jgi:hypothetical protein
MPENRRREEDELLRRVAAARPAVPEDELSPETPRARTMLEQIIATSPRADENARSTFARPRYGPGRPRRGWRHPGTALPGAALLALAAVIAVAVLVLGGTFSGPDSSGTLPAAAAVIRATQDVIRPTAGSVFVEDETYVSGPMARSGPFTLYQVLETPARGPQNELTASNQAARFSGTHSQITATSFVGGTQSVFNARTNTIYESSIWGPYLHRRPGTNLWIYRDGPGAAAYRTHPIVVTARQRQGLLRGTLCLRTTGKLVNGKVQVSGLKVLPPLRGPAEYAGSLQQEIHARKLHFLRRLTVRGRAAFEYGGRDPSSDGPVVHMYFDARTDVLFQEVDSVGTKRQQEVRLGLQKLPVTAASTRLLSVRALHPGARVDHSFRDYLRAAHGLAVFDQ